MSHADPMRTCVGCRKVRAKAELLRIVRHVNGTVSLDPTGKSEGRGVYVCRTPECVETAVRRKALERGLKHAVPEEAVEELKTVISCIRLASQS
jgi:predicted RNA-binding protein YlxR (DUF448 family)